MVMELLTIPNKLAVGLLRVYQCAVSPVLVSIFGSNSGCRFEPTCSNYAIQSYQQYNFFKASGLTVKRLSKCSPLFKGGFDPVPHHCVNGVGRDPASQVVQKS